MPTYLRIKAVNPADFFHGQIVIKYFIRADYFGLWKMQKTNFGLLHLITKRYNLKDRK